MIPDRVAEAHSAASKGAVPDNLFESHKGASTHEQNVLCVQLQPRNPRFRHHASLPSQGFSLRMAGICHFSSDSVLTGL